MDIKSSIKLLLWVYFGDVTVNFYANYKFRTTSDCHTIKNIHLTLGYRLFIPDCTVATTSSCRSI